MAWNACLLVAIALEIGCCGGAGEHANSAVERPDAPERRESVFDPLTSTIDRAEGVQQTVDEQAAEQRRRIEDAER